jgi:metal-dependent HD superfamily phosphatase/phosphodiesterase
MSEAIEISKKYFSLSNEPNLEEISKLFTDNTIYNSKNTGNYLGVKNIISMQKKFYNDFNKINWVINTLEEINI